MAADSSPSHAPAVVIPVLNAGDHAAGQLAALATQTLRPSRVIVLDSESTDGSPARYAEAGCEVHRVPRRHFDHGGTRNLAASIARPAEVIVYMTQDAVPAHPEALERIVAPFADSAVALVCGRQLPRRGAGPIERHARRYNYPSGSSRRDIKVARGLGLKAAFNSNSFAAYRTCALLEAGGFPERIIMGEDQIAAARILLGGWSVAYAGDAAVFHSHRYSPGEEFRRYFDIGVFHAQHRVLVDGFGDPGGEGLRYVRAEMRFLAERAPLRIPEALMRDAAKLLAYRLGRKQAALPRWCKRFFAMHRGFFAPEQLGQARAARR